MSQRAPEWIEIWLLSLSTVRRRIRKNHKEKYSQIKLWMYRISICKSLWSAKMSSFFRISVIFSASSAYPCECKMVRLVFPFSLPIFRYANCTSIFVHVRCSISEKKIRSIFISIFEQSLMLFRSRSFKLNLLWFAVCLFFCCSLPYQKT